MIKAEEKRRRNDSSFLDDLLHGLSRSLFNGLAERLEDGARELLGRSLKHLALTLVAIGITISAGVLILIAGVEGLQQASVPPALSYLIAGIIGLAIGIAMILLRR